MVTEDDVAELAATRTIDITTIGRHSGKPARIEIWWFHLDGEFVITGSPGPRDWYANVLADPAITVHTPMGDFTGRASPIRDPETRRRVLSDPELSWYQTQAELDRLVASSPMIRIAFD